MTDPAFDQQRGYYLDEIRPGLKALFAKTITDADVTLFAGISGDTNPLHINDDFASQTRFKKRIVPGMVTTSLWSTLVGTRLPGPGCAYLSQETRFLKPVFPGDTVTATLTITAVDQDRQIVRFDATCTVNHTVVAQGPGSAWVPRRP
ncbi:MAG: MaoC family dehydratase [Pseudomonadota bacterium]